MADGARGSSVDCLLDARAQLGESPVWSIREQRLYWVDILAPALHRFDPSSGTDEVWAMPAAIGCCSLTETGDVIVALASGFHAFSPTTGLLTAIADPEPDLPNHRLNDGRCDRAGRFWVGSMRDPPGDGSCGSLYSLSRDRQLTRHLGGIAVPNGLAFSPDNEALYLSDSHPATRSIWQFDFDLAEGRISNQRLFVDTHDMPGRPDGAAIDSDGCYWSAANDGWEIVRYTPAGTVDRRIALPVAKPSMVAFGGPGLDLLFVTSIRPAGSENDQPLAGGLFVCRPGPVGMPEPYCRIDAI